MDTPVFILSLVGAVTGVAGAVLGVINHLRDRARAEVILKWDMTSSDARHESRQTLGSRESHQYWATTVPSSYGFSRTAERLRAER
jgi:hypothetical protein